MPIGTSILAYMQLGKLDKAITAYQAALKTDPSYEVAQMALLTASESN
jgi:tetratricopeptide (TPR) repeat protein